MRRLILTVLLLAVGLPLAALAQEELPAPPPAAPPKRVTPQRPPLLSRDLTDQQRAERREKLRNIGGQVLGALLPPGDGVGPDAAVPLDIGKLNAGLGPIVAALLGGGENIESLRIGFDPQGTNFAADRIRLGADAVMRRTAWADGPSRLNASLGAQITQADTGGLVALLDGRMRLQTQTVALANYALAQYKSRQQQNQAAAPQAPAPEGVAPLAGTADDLFSQMLNERLARVDSLDSLDDVADLLTTISGLRLTAASQRIEQLRDAARSAPDDATRRDLEAQLAQVRAERDRLFDVRPRFGRGSDGRVHTIQLEMIGSELFAGAEMRALDFRMTENEVTIQAAGALTRWVELYPVVKPLVMNVLVRIQAGDPRAIDGVRPFIDGPINRGRAIIIGEPPREF
jgi:hypothetical protein